MISPSVSAGRLNKRAAAPEVGRRQRRTHTQVPQVVDHEAIEAVLHRVEEQLARPWLPGAPDPVFRQAGLLSKRADVFHEQRVVHRIILVRQHDVAEVERQIVFVGDQDADNGGIVLVGQASIRIDMLEQLMLKLLHKFPHVLIEIIESKNVALASLDFVETSSHAVAGHQGAIVDHINPYINSFVLEAFDPPIEAIERFGIEMPGILAAVIEENVGPDPVGLVLVNTHQIVAELSHPVRLAVGCFRAGCSRGLMRRDWLPRIGRGCRPRR